MEFVSDTESKHSPYLDLTLDQFQLIGRSVAGIETVLAIPQWGLCFDVGRSPDFAFAQRHLALTHWHLDHAGGLAVYLGLRHLNSLPELKIILPREKVEETRDFLKQLRSLSDSELRYEVVAADGAVPLKNNLQLKGIPTFHCVPSSGYLVESVKHHLKPEFDGKATEEIVTAKSAGQEVNESVVEALLAFSGDSTGEFLETDAVKAKYLVMECSFFGDSSNYDKIHAYGHTHIIDWQNHADRIESERIIMIHTSLRYSKKDIETSCKKSLPKDLLDRLIVLR